MQRLQAFKYELMPNGAQERAMRCFAGSCRFVYNKALAMQFVCIDCGYENHADVVGAINILERGHRLLAACGEPVQSGRSVKQEPPEATLCEFTHG